MTTSPQIIHDIRHPDKLTLIMEELGNQGINDAVIWEATITLPTIEACINKSHKDIVRWAKEREMPEVCIMEDDVMFVNGGWKDFLANKPEEYDLYLGGAYGISTWDDPGWSRFSRRRVAQFQGLHCYLISQRFYDKFLAVPDDVHIDTAQQGLIYVIQPMIALQRSGYSATCRGYADYNNKIDLEKYRKFLEKNPYKTTHED